MIDDGISCLVWGCVAKGRSLAETQARVALELGRELTALELEEVESDALRARDSIAKTPAVRD